MKRTGLILSFLCAVLPLAAQILGHDVGKARLWQRTDFTVRLCARWENPFLQEEVSMDVILTSPSGRTLKVPCFFLSGEGELHLPDSL